MLEVSSVNPGRRCCKPMLTSTFSIDQSNCTRCPVLTSSRAASRLAGVR
jgi:hypothetical protein